METPPALHSTIKIQQSTISGGQRAAQRAFQFQQSAFDIETSAVAAQGSIRGDDAVARHYDGYGISIVRHAHGAKPLGTAHRARDVRVGASFAVRNFEECPPAGEL